MRLRKKPFDTVEEPIDLRGRTQENAAQHEAGATFRVRLPICECQRRTPRAAKYQPLLDTEHLPQMFDVRDQQLRGVVTIFAQRRRSTGTTLIEQHDAVIGRIEKAPVFGGQAAARSAMQKQYRDAVRIAALFPIQRVQFVHWQHAGLIGFDCGKQDLLGRDVDHGNVAT